MITQSLDEIADQYKSYLQTVLIEMITDFSTHIVGTHSVYVLTFIVDGRKFLYVGQTKAPSSRASKHKSALKMARVSTKVGISKLFTPDLLGSAKSVTLEFKVVHSGMTREEAIKKEKKVASDYTATFGSEVMLVSP